MGGSSFFFPFFEKTRNYLMKKHFRPGLFAVRFFFFSLFPKWRKVFFSFWSADQKSFFSPRMSGI